MNYLGGNIVDMRLKYNLEYLLTVLEYFCKISFDWPSISNTLVIVFV